MQNIFQIDLLAAARCNLFSYSLAAYQTNWTTINLKNQEVLEAHIKVIEKEPRKHKFGILKELAQENGAASKATDESTDPVKIEANDDDQRLFFGDEFSDSCPAGKKKEESKSEGANEEAKLVDYELEEFMSSSNILLPSQLLMDDSLFDNSPTNSNLDLLSSLVPSQAEQSQSQNEHSKDLHKNPSKKANDVSKWFNLFSDLDPLNQQSEQDDASKNLHAA